MLDLRPMTPAELDIVCELELDPDTMPYILPTPRAQHRANMARDDMAYLSIYQADRFAGYFILVLDVDDVSIECRRIVIAEKGAGTGRRAMGLMEAYCRERLGRKRIWLDVFDFNQRGRHLYPGLGYRYIGDQEVDGKRLLFYEKQLR